MSLLFRMINTDSLLGPISYPKMPFERSPLTPEKIAFLKRWIDEGARKDAGQLPFSNPRMGKVYATNQAADLIAVIDIETNLVMRYVKVGMQVSGSFLDAPHNVIVDDSGQYYYATLIQSWELWKFRVSDDQFIGKVNLGIFPGHVVVSADGRKTYVTDFNLSGSSGRVKVIDTETMTEQTTISMGTLARGVHGARLSHDRSRLFTANHSTSSVTVISTVDNSVEAIVMLDPNQPPGTANLQPFQVAVHPDDRYVYTSCYKSSSPNGEVRVIDTDSMKVISVITVGTRPIQVEVTPDGAKLFVCNQGSDNVSVISTATNTVIATIDSLPRQPHGVDFTVDGRFAYVTCENQVDPIPPHHPTMGLTTPSYIVAIDVTTLQVIKRIEVGSYAAGVSVTPGRGN